MFQSETLEYFSVDKPEFSAVQKTLMLSSSIKSFQFVCSFLILGIEANKARLQH